MTAHAGTIDLTQGFTLARVLALSPDGRVCGETQTDGAGRWRIDCAAEVSSLIAHTFREGIVAVEVSASRGALALPQGHPCSVECAEADDAVRFWIDPVQLDTVSAGHLAALHWQAGGVIRLHVAEWPCAPMQAIRLQTGRYRVAGGSIALHSGGPPGRRLSGVTVDGADAAATDLGGFEFEIAGSARIVLTFTETAP